MTSAAMEHWICRFGPGKLFGDNTSGLVARLIEGWKYRTIHQPNFWRAVEYQWRAKRYYAATGKPYSASFLLRETLSVAIEFGDAFGNFFGQQYKEEQYEPEVEEMLT